MARPFSYPTPKFHNGEQTLSVRFTVDGKIVKRSCGTADFNEAKRRVPNIVEKARAAPVAPLNVPARDLESLCLKFRDELTKALQPPKDNGTSFADKLARNIAATQARTIVEQASTRIATTTDLTTRRALMFTLTETLREVGQSWSPGWNFTHVALGTASSKPQATIPANSPLLSAFLDRFLDDNKIVGDYANEHRAIVRDFSLIVGDRPITSYRKDDARRLKEVLTTLPANWTKLKTLRHLPINQAAEKARELGYQPQKPKTLGFKRSMLSTSTGVVMAGISTTCVASGGAIFVGPTSTITTAFRGTVSGSPWLGRPENVGRVAHRVSEAPGLRPKQSTSTMRGRLLKTGIYVRSNSLSCGNRNMAASPAVMICESVWAVGTSETL